MPVSHRAPLEHSNIQETKSAIWFIFQVFSQVNKLQLLAIQWKTQVMKLSDSCQRRPYWRNVEFVYEYLKIFCEIIIYFNHK